MIADFIQAFSGLQKVS